MTKTPLFMGAAMMAALLSPNAGAHENGKTGTHAMDHAPIGVMADHRHKTGERMTSYRFMTMDMDGSRDGTDRISPDIIATTVPNRFAGMPGQPPTLRVVPTNMRMDMHMVGVMYGLSDRITLMGMASYHTKDMNHITYMGGLGTAVRGTFETNTSGFGDTTLGAIIGLDDGNKAGRQINFNIGLSLPTGSNSETDQILTPMGGTPSPRLPYPMQLGTGTYDLKPGLTYFDRVGKIGWGSQISARFALADNDEDYRFGNSAQGTAWLSYEPKYWLSFSGRLKVKTTGKIDGRDAAVTAPVQTADPDNAGGNTVEAFIGVNLAGQSGYLKGHRLALEYGLPLYRDLNGPQLETDNVMTLGWQKAF